MFPKPDLKKMKRQRRNITRITKEVNDEVLRRSDHLCEKCGTGSAWGFERAHLIKASQGGRGDHPAFIVLLCGPSVNTGTCHNFVDYTADGREWRLKKHKELKRFYEDEMNWPIEYKF